MSALIDSVIGTYEDKSPYEIQTSLKALAWARVSTDMQEERGLSMPEQLRQIREYADRNGITILEEYHEAASAFRKESQRVEFHRMLDRAKSDKTVNCILVHDYSRFSRDSLGARMLVRELRQVGVRVISVNDLEVDPETVAGVYMEAITFAKNEAYSREVAFHTKKGCRANIQTRDPETGWCYKNGGQPLWGYRSERLMRGELKKGRPLIKSIWVPDDRIVSGKTIHEWTRYCLVELAAKGASLDELRDFCNSNGIPAPRKQYWGSTTWHSLLHPNCLLKYSGYEVWNVRGKNQRWNPPDQWTVVENAHPALISEEEAQRIIETRKTTPHIAIKPTSNRSRSSSFLLSGGMFTCGRCGSNMMGYRRSGEGTYYICGSQPYRKGMGCGPGVYVPQATVEAEVMVGLRDLLGICADPKEFTRQVNEELRKLWETSNGNDPGTVRRLSEVGRKIKNIRHSIEEGVPDTRWAYQRMSELLTEQEQLQAQGRVIGEAPQIEIETALAYRRETEKVLTGGNDAEKKCVLRSSVDHIKLTPETLEVEIKYRVPEFVVNRVGAGAGFEPTTFGL